MSIKGLIVKKECKAKEIFDALLAGKHKYLKASLRKERLMVFVNKGTKCAGCETTGIVFRLEKYYNQSIHWNLYAIVNNKYILMTADHIIPRSRGGPTTQENLQPMCQPCNVLKKDLLPGENVYDMVKKQEKITANILSIF